jgi:hypothetical protein
MRLASHLRSALPLALPLALALSLAACGGGPDASHPDAHSLEAQAQAGYDVLKDKDDPQPLIDLYQRYPKTTAGRKALFVGVDKYSTQAEKLAKACKDTEARDILTTIAGLSADETSIDSKVDALKEKVEKYRRKCRLDALEASLEAAKKDMDWPKVFEVIDDEELAKDIDSKTIGRKRDDVKKAWLAAIDKTLGDIVKRRSAALVVDEHRKGWLASIDPKNYPEDLREDLQARAAKIKGVMLVFDKLEGGSIIDPPERHWTFGDVKVRLATAPETEGTQLFQGLPFMVVAQGKVGTEMMFAVGKPEGDEMARLASITFLVPQKHAKSWDTRMLVPETIAGARVFAPISAGNKELGAFDVIEEKDGFVFATPIGKTNKVKFKRAELRGFYLPVGTKVKVSLNYAWKKGEVTVETTEGDDVAVRVNGDAVPTKVADLRVDRDALPKIPTD